MRGVGDRAFLQHIVPAAIGAIDRVLLAHVQEDARMAERAVAAVAGDDRFFHGDGLERLHSLNSF